MYGDARARHINSEDVRHAPPISLVIVPPGAHRSVDVALTIGRRTSRRVSSCV